VISSGKTTKVIIVSTPYGLNHFYKMWVDAEEGRSTYKPLEVHWSQVPGRDAAWKEETVRNTSEEQFRQEFECVDGDTIIEIYDKKTKEEYRVRIKDLYDLI
jgi:phage FluMu gp28-like protein